MKIAMIGTRGVPANYGGFETCVEEVGWRLVREGHSVSVYCRNGYYEEKNNVYRGMDLVHLPHFKRKSLDTISHTFLSILHALFMSYDILMVFNAANSLMLILPRIFGAKIAINTDGLEWKRGKWGKAAKKYYRFSEWLSTKISDRVVADSLEIQRYYRDKYGADSSHIAYGAYVTKSLKPELIKPLGLSPGEYFLQITRFEPENNPLLTIKAYKKLQTQKPLVLVGGVKYESKYSRQIIAESNNKIILPGFIYEKNLLRELWCNCYAYIHGNEVGGTNPALLQAMASGCFTVSIDVSFNNDVLKNCGIYYQKNPESLADQLNWTLENQEKLPDYKNKAIKRIEKYYSWEGIAEKYEDLFFNLISKKK